MKILSAATLVLLMGCAADRYTDKEMTKYDDRTEYRVEDADDGFLLYIWYSHTSVFQSMAHIERQGLKQMHLIAYEIAESRKREIEKIDEDRVKSNTGKTFWDVASWSAKVKVYYKKP